MGTRCAPASQTPKTIEEEEEEVEEEEEEEEEEVKELGLYN